MQKEKYWVGIDDGETSWRRHSLWSLCRAGTRGKACDDAYMHRAKSDPKASSSGALPSPPATRIAGTFCRSYLAPAWPGLAWHHLPNTAQSPFLWIRGSAEDCSCSYAPSILAANTADALSRQMTRSCTSTTCTRVRGRQRSALGAAEMLWG